MSRNEFLSENREIRKHQLLIGLAEAVKSNFEGQSCLTEFEEGLLDNATEILAEFGDESDGDIE